MKKTCTRCDETKPFAEFHRTKATKDGFHTRCKVCRRAADAKLYQRQRDSRKAAATAYYRENADTVKAKKRERYASDPEYRQRCLESARADSSRRHAARKANPVHAFADRIRHRLRVTLKQQGVFRKRAPTFDLLGYEPTDLYGHLSRYLGSPCECCGKTVVLETCHIDHVVPVHTARTEAEVIALNALANLRLICGPCNLKKQGRLETI